MKSLTLLLLFGLIAALYAATPKRFQDYNDEYDEDDIENEMQREDEKTHDFPEESDDDMRDEEWADPPPKPAVFQRQRSGGPESYSWRHYLRVKKDPPKPAVFQKQRSGGPESYSWRHYLRVKK